MFWRVFWKDWLSRMSCAHDKRRGRLARSVALMVSARRVCVKLRGTFTSSWASSCMVCCTRREVRVETFVKTRWSWGVTKVWGKVRIDDGVSSRRDGNLD